MTLVKDCNELTVKTQLKTPPQSPVLQAAPDPSCPLRLLAPLPSTLKLQFVLPQIRPCQSALTSNSLLLPDASSNPPVPPPVPFCVPIPGQIVCEHLFVTMMGLVSSLFVGGPRRGGLLRGDANFSNIGFVVYDKAVEAKLSNEQAATSFHGCDEEV